MIAKFINYFLIILFLNQVLNLNGQTIENSRVVNLDNPDQFEERGIFIQTKQIESTKEVTIFLINKSDRTIQVPSYNGYISIDREVLTKEKEWRNIDSGRDIWCATGYGITELKPNQYTYVKKKMNCTGELATKIRYGIVNTDNQVILSKAVSTRIQEDYLTGIDSRFLDQINKSSCEDAANSEEIVKLELMIIKYLYHDLKDYMRAVEKCQRVKGLYGDQDELTYELGLIYVSSLNNYSNQDLAIRQGIVCAAMEEWDKIGKSKVDLKRKTSEIMNYYEEHLPTKKEILESELNCVEQDNGGVKCYIPLIVNKMVNMRFRAN